MKNKVHFIDCGGNIGQSVEYALQLEGIDKVDTFEPFEMNYSHITEKYGENEKVFLHTKAVSTENKSARFYVQDWGARTGSSLELGKSSTTPNKFIDVECVDICQWIRENLKEENYNIFKIDIEGTEYEVIDKILSEELDVLIDKWLIEWTPKAKLPNLDKQYMDDVIKRFESRNPVWVDWSFHY